MTDFVSEIPAKERSELQLRIDTFVSEHASHHRPIAVVSSGGTVADLELHSVRCLDNFSTGTRGACSVEEFLERGYAVVHLWRESSASPYARVIANHLGLAAQQALTCESLSRLFAAEDDALIESVLEDNKQDPFLTEPQPEWTRPETSDDLALSRSIVHSSRIHRALRQRAAVLQDSRLLTISFRSVEDYLARLQLIAESLRDTESLTVFFLAAAVSDFYVPREQRTEHKIQSHGSKGLVLELEPVPKTIGLLRSRWAPDAFVVSFKLETDASILQQKAQGAVDKYGVHLVVGNLLQSRHDKVWILSPEHQREKTPTTGADWSMTEITRTRLSDHDSLESSIVDFVVQSHFEYISWHFHQDGSGVKAAQRTQRRLAEKKRQIQKQILWKKIQKTGLEVSGALVAVALSYAINSALQRRLRG